MASFLRRLHTQPDHALLLAVTLTYASLGVVLGFVQGGVAPVLRSQGMPLSAMRWVYALYLPFGVAFLWAPLIDAWRWPWLGPRTGWILPMQALAVMATLAIAWIGPGHWGWLLALGLVATMAAATMDAALDALTVDRIAASRRTAAAAAKLGGISLGSILGGGVLVASYPTLQWSATLSLVAALMAASSLPVLALVGADRRLAPAPIRPGLGRLLRQPGMGRRFIRLTLLAATLMALFSFNRLMLVDMGVPLEKIGSLLGTTAPLATALACLLAPAIQQRLGLRRAACLLAGLCLANAGLIWLALSLHQPSLLIAGSIMASAWAAALYVVVGGLILQWAHGEQAATDYALLYGVGRFLGTVCLMLLPGLIAHSGWPRFQVAIALAFALAAYAFLGEVNRPPAARSR